MNGSVRVPRCVNLAARAVVILVPSFILPLFYFVLSWVFPKSMLFTIRNLDVLLYQTLVRIISIIASNDQPTSYLSLQDRWILSSAVQPAVRRLASTARHKMGQHLLGYTKGRHLSLCTRCFEVAPSSLGECQFHRWLCVRRFDAQVVERDSFNTPPARHCFCWPGAFPVLSNACWSRLYGDIY